MGTVGTVFSVPFLKVIARHLFRPRPWCPNSTSTPTYRRLGASRFRCPDRACGPLGQDFSRFVLSSASRSSSPSRSLAVPVQESWPDRNSLTSLATGDASNAKSLPACRLPVDAAMNWPGSNPNAVSPAVAQRAKSAILGSVSKVTEDVFFDASETAVSIAPKMAGRICSNFCQNSASLRRRCSGMVGRFTGIDRSNRSLRVASSSIPLMMTGLVESKMISSSFSYNIRVLKPPPVDRRQRLSDSHFAASLVRAGALREHPELGEILNELGGRITKKKIQELNHQVEVKGKTARDVAEGFLLATGLIGKGAEPETEKTGTVTVAGKHFTEQDVLCEIMSIMIERKTKLGVVRLKRFGDTRECFDALRSGDIDVYAEYIGSTIVACFPQDPMSPWGDEVALNARVRFAQAERDAFEAEQAFLDECRKLGGTAGDAVQEAVIMQRLTVHAISWENRLIDLLGAPLTAGLGDYAKAAQNQRKAAQNQRKLVGELVDAITLASDRDNTPSLEQQKDAFESLAGSLTKIAETVFSSDPRSPSDWEQGLRMELAAHSGKTNS